MRAGPGFAEAVAERRVHDLHHRVEVVATLPGSIGRVRSSAGVAITPPPSAARRARGRRPAWPAGVRSFCGKRQRVGGGRQASRLRRMPRASTSASAPEPTTSGAVDCCRGRGGRQVAKRRWSGSRHAVELLDEQLAMTAGDARRDFARQRRASGEQRERRHAGKPAPQPIARPCAAAIADADAGEAAGADSDQDAGSASARRAARRSSAPAARLWPRPISSSVRATHSPPPSNKAAVQAALDVSNARIMGVNSGHRRRKRRNALNSDRLRPSRPRGRNGGSGFRSRASGSRPRTGSPSRRRASRDRAVPSLIALVDDVAAVLGDRGADAGFDQLLDLVDDVGVGRIFVEIRVARDVDAGRACRARTAARR